MLPDVYNMLKSGSAAPFLWLGHVIPIQTSYFLLTSLQICKLSGFGTSFEKVIFCSSHFPFRYNEMRAAVYLCNQYMQELTRKIWLILITPESRALAESVIRWLVLRAVQSLEFLLFCCLVVFNNLNWNVDCHLDLDVLPSRLLDPNCHWVACSETNIRSDMWCSAKFYRQNLQLTVPGGMNGRKY